MEKQRAFEQQEGERSLFAPRYEPGTFVPSVINDPNKLTSGDISAMIPGRNVASPETEAFLSQYPQNTRPVIQSLLERGASWRDVESKFPKVPLDKTAMTLENILAEKVKTGQMTLQEALQLKKEKDKEPSNAYQDFASGYKSMLAQQHPDWTPEQINLATATEAEKRKLSGQLVVANVRIPAFQQGANLPPGYVFNRKTGSFDYKGGESVTPMGGSLATAGSDWKADIGALSALTKSQEQVMAFEKTASKNLEYAVKLSDKFDRTQFPPANAVINALKTKTGDPNIVKFATATYAAALEYQKVVTAGSGVTSAELSVGAQKKAEEIISKSHTKEQFRANLEALKTDMANRKAAYNEQIQEVRSRVSGAIGGGKTETQPTSKKYRIIMVK